MRSGTATNRNLDADAIVDINNHSKGDSRRITEHWPFFLFGLASFLLLFWGLGNRGLWGSEGRWAEVSREMFLTGDFFHPRIGGEPYFDKPLLTYWLITGISAMTGVLNEWVVRLPSAIFGFISIYATVTLGRRLWSAQVGLLAGWFMLTSYGLVLWSRTAAADTENLAAVTLCILWYWVRRDKLNFITFLIFYLIAFLGALTKGLTAVVVPIIAILPDLVMEKRWKVLFGPSHILAFGVSAAVYLSPIYLCSQNLPSGLSLQRTCFGISRKHSTLFQTLRPQKPFLHLLLCGPIARFTVGADFGGKSDRVAACLEGPRQKNTMVNSSDGHDFPVFHTIRFSTLLLYTSHPAAMRFVNGGFSDVHSS